ncbi:HEPN domain-containing protein [Candidatus Aerophobetes bacterium]|nr:HEPN domain-containing protein [Candidatus Aerophobetes bacterium]
MSSRSLGELVQLAMKEDENFNQIIELADKLTPYAVEIRYLDILIEEPIIDKAKEAIKIAIK